MSGRRVLALLFPSILVMLFLTHSIPTSSLQLKRASSRPCAGGGVGCEDFSRVRARSKPAMLRRDWNAMSPSAFTAKPLIKSHHQPTSPTNYASVIRCSHSASNLLSSNLLIATQVFSALVITITMHSIINQLLTGHIGTSPQPYH